MPMQADEAIDELVLRGLQFAAAGDWAGALPLLLQAGRLRPDEPHPCLDLLQRQGDHYAIEQTLRAALADRPRAPLVALQLARLQREQGRVGEALDLARRVVAWRPDWPDGHRFLAWVLGDLGELAESAAASQAALQLDPNDAAAWTNLGVALTHLGRHAAGEAAHNRALQLAPGQPRVRVNRAWNLLAQGRLQEGWQDYEWRLNLPGHSVLPRALLLPDLASGVAIAGKTILITHEDGLGDTIQFARFVPLLRDRGARVLAHVPPPLERLFRTLGHGITLLPSSAPVPAFDYHCPYTSLPRVFGVSLDSIPNAPYLAAEPELVRHWAQKLPPGRRIGLVWAGQARPWVDGFGPLNGRRSMALARLAPLGRVAGVSWISLQKGPAAHELENIPPDLVIHDPMIHVNCLADTAAILASLEAVVSVDTSVAHLAGATGIKVYLLDRFDSCWRWLRNRNDSPWYPSLAIYRQTKIGDWTQPIDSVVRELAHNLAPYSPS